MNQIYILTNEIITFLLFVLGMDGVTFFFFFLVKVFDRFDLRYSVIDAIPI